MRIIKFSTLTFILIVLLFSVTNKAVANSAQVQVDNLNVREEPSTTANIIDNVHSNDEFEVIQADDEWVEIKLDDTTTGWVSAEYVSITDQTSDANNDTDPNSMTNITIPINNLHVRSGASTDNDILFFAQKGMDFNVISESDDWYEIKNDEQSGFIRKSFLQEHTLSEIDTLKNKVFVVDAGHGGYDVGAIGVNESYEKDIALTTTMKFKKTLTDLGAKVFLTRNNDEFIRLGSRVSFANIINPHAFISIHYNSFPELPHTTGIVSHFYDENDEQLADKIQQQLIMSTGDKDRGAVYKDLQVLRHNQNQAVLLELGFLSQEEQEALLLTNNYQEQLVRGIINGLNKYYASE